MNLLSINRPLSQVLMHPLNLRFGKILNWIWQSMLEWNFKEIKTKEKERLNFCQNLQYHKYRINFFSLNQNYNTNNSKAKLWIMTLKSFPTSCWLWFWAVLQKWRWFFFVNVNGADLKTVEWTLILVLNLIQVFGRQQLKVQFA